MDMFVVLTLIDTLAIMVSIYENNRSTSIHRKKGHSDIYNKPCVMFALFIFTWLKIYIEYH